MFTADSIRSDFPALAHGHAFFDAPGGTQMPRPVAEAMLAVSLSPLSNRGTGSVAELNAERSVHEFRTAAADLLGADPGGIVHGRSATQIYLEFARTLAHRWTRGDNIVLSTLEHDSNVAPWLIAAERAGVEVRWARFDNETGELPISEYERLVDPRTRLVAVTAASNLIGTQPDVAGIAAVAHAVGALVTVDGVHSTAHAAVDVTALGADFYTFSPYKILGPHCAVLAAAPDLLDDLHPDKLRPATDAVPERFELGTLPYEQLAGVTALVDYLAGLAPESEEATPAEVAAGGVPLPTTASASASGGNPAAASVTGSDGDPAAASATGVSDRRARVLAAMHAIDEFELDLRSRLEAGLAEIPGLIVYSRAQRRTSTILVTAAGHDSRAVTAALREKDVLVQAGSFYAYEPCRQLGLGEAGGIRFGLAPYSTADDVDRLVRGLAEVVAG